MQVKRSAISDQRSAIQNTPWGLYVSVPFCRFKCTFCNFASGVYPQRELDRYVDALIAEIDSGTGGAAPEARVFMERRPASTPPRKLRVVGTPACRRALPQSSNDQAKTKRCCAEEKSDNGERGPAGNPDGEPVRVEAGAPWRRDVADSLYFGGGTPSILPPEQLERIFSALRARFEVANDAEITLEAAPGSIPPELARAWCEAGVNRISLGVQSFVERELRAVGRPHRAETVARELELLRQSGIGSVNIDLIAGLPHQTPAAWDESLDGIARLKPEHVSVYIFEIDEDSRLGSEVLAGGSRYSAASVPSEDATADYYCHAIERLGAMGIAQYEISNFAAPGFESRHNLKYWQHTPYLGFGVDAHSFDGAERWANTDSLEAYLDAMENGRSPVVARNAVDQRQRAEERIILGLRQNGGIELMPDEVERYRREIGKMSDAGLLELRGRALRLTPRGRLLSNEIFAEFIE